MKKKAAQSRPWTEKDERFMRKYYAAHSTRWMAEQLDRTYTAVKQRASTMFLTKDPAPHRIGGVSAYKRA